MDELIAITEFNWAHWLIGLLLLFEFFKWAVTGFEWLGNKFGFETKKMRQKREKQEEWEERLANAENAIIEIKDTAKANVDTFLGIKDEVIKELGKIHTALDAQKETDCAMLRDRISSGMRYFSQNQDEDGNVHISFSDYVNLDALFQQYFAKDGNGPFKKMYEDEFLHFIIDR